MQPKEKRQRGRISSKRHDPIVGILTEVFDKTAALALASAVRRGPVEIVGSFKFAVAVLAHLIRLARSIGLDPRKVCKPLRKQNWDGSYFDLRASQAALESDFSSNAAKIVDELQRGPEEMSAIAGVNSASLMLSAAIEDAESKKAKKDRSASDISPEFAAETIRILMEMSERSAAAARPGATSDHNDFYDEHGLPR